MVPFGGVGDMLLGALASGVVFALVGLVLSRWLGFLGAVSWCGLLWWLSVIAVVTLIPANGAPGVVSAQGRRTSCSWDIGAYSPHGFWIFDGNQRTLNTLLFVPAGVLLVLALARRSSGWFLAPLGLVALAAYSAGIELTQLELARLDRACDVTDIIDNATGAVIGFGVGLVLTVVLRPWRRGPQRGPRRGPPARSPARSVTRE